MRDEREERIHEQSYKIIDMFDGWLSDETLEVLMRITDSYIRTYVDSARMIDSSITRKRMYKAFSEELKKRLLEDNLH